MKYKFQIFAKMKEIIHISVVLSTWIKDIILYFFNLFQCYL